MRRNPISGRIVCVAFAALMVLHAAQVQNREEFVLKTEIHADLVFHLLAHMDIGEDASSLYSPGYISMINEDKARAAGSFEPLERSLAAATKIFVTDQNLRMVNFLPFACDGYESLLLGLRWMAGEETGESPSSYFSYFKKRFFHSPEAEKFLSLFAANMEREYESFYQDYWARRQKELLPFKEDFFGFWRDHGMKLMAPVMRKHGKGSLVFLSLSLTRNGRGFASPGFFGAAVKFPESREEIPDSFFWSIHEMTHQFVDEITLKAASVGDVAAGTMAGNRGYDIHLLKEKAVVYADYLLCREFLPELLEDYLFLFLGLFEKKDRTRYAGLSQSGLEDRFRDVFEVPDQVRQAIEGYVGRLIGGPMRPHRTYGG